MKEYEELRSMGILHLEQLAGASWTDFNSHDPGITILEQLCYALTDLSYRIDFDISDLFASTDAIVSDTLFDPARILPTAPVTLADWRKVAVDVSGVRNAWVEVATGPDFHLFYDEINQSLSQVSNGLDDQPLQLQGLYRVLLDIPSGDSSRVVEAVRQRLHSVRGLCTDFVDIKQIEPQPVTIQARVEIGAVDNADAVLLAILQGAANYIAPPVQFTTLQEQIAAARPLDEVYAGPLLDHGFIDDESLERSQRRTEIHASDLIQIMMDVEGVRAVPSIIMSANGRNESWLLPLDAERAPDLSAPHGSNSHQDGTRIQLQRNGLPVHVNMRDVVSAFESWRTNTRVHKRQQSDVSESSLPNGRDRGVSRYHSIQHQFPATYGIGENGLPKSATVERNAQAQQLKGYLLFFDQLLANQFAQLDYAKVLLSAESSTDTFLFPSYASQPINDPTLGIDSILQLSPDALQTLTEPSEASGAERRNRFLNHLLARFGEQFVDYALVQSLQKTEAEADGGITVAKLIADKQAFLQSYPQLSQRRGTGFNYLLSATKENRSGVEKRIRLKLGLEEPEESFIMVEHILLRPVKNDNSQREPLLQGSEDASLNPDPYSLQLSFVFSESPARFSSKGFRRFVDRTVREETPAHLLTHVRWVSAKTFDAFQTRYEQWLDRRRAYWKATA